MHVLGGSWVVISGVISPLKSVIAIVTQLIALLRTTHEPPSRALNFPSGFYERLRVSGGLGLGYRGLDTWNRGFGIHCSIVTGNLKEDWW